MIGCIADASVNNSCERFAGTTPHAARKISRANVEPVFGMWSQETLRSSVLRAALRQQSAVPQRGRGGVQPSGGGSVAAIGSRF